MSKRSVSRKMQLLVLAFVLLALAIGAWLLYRHDELKYKEVLVLGHAGSGFFSPLNPFNPLPSNSMASIVKAMEENGADGVEVDVQLSQDGVPILYHDVTLASITSSEGIIDNLSAAEVVGLKYKGGFFYDLFHDEEIITLETLLQRFATYPELPYLHIDLRNHSPSRHLYYAQTLMALLRKYNYPLQKLVFISPNPNFLKAFGEVEPQAQLMIDTAGDFEQALVEANNYNLHGICANGRDVTEEQVQRAREQGLQVALFGGKSRSRIARMINMRPDAIQTDNVGAMRDMLE
ncbi:glycerophosphodiester phosphodiesterase [Pontibacter anaerobius]|uniref:Glycerophosphodiester phosphodiesterase family protein n=1 Tax=Pontibacter anaerobius TaxID=2993940 RepID=A0ABT3RD14_9BACT|nr:glycerophosphodiester phosphodiesterase family protein [Pontibacter anaerobius]MCX2739437.1 glycerophosphodiester phosphodiesterase family protein [Pontibacter anaerobius]